jgi:hypothetical protein
MKVNRDSLIKVICGFAFGCSVMANAALPAEWQHAQQFNVTTSGLVKISLPVETLDAARPALEDLRLCDDAGNELPFLITRPMPSAKAVQGAKSFQVSLNASTTVITLETGLAQPLDGVTLETPAMNFIKAVRVEGSADGQNWQRLAQGQPIFRRRMALAAAHRGRPAFAAGSVHRRPRPRRRCRSDTDRIANCHRHRAKRKSRRNTFHAESWRGESGRGLGKN